MRTFAFLALVTLSSAAHLFSCSAKKSRKNLVSRTPPKPPGVEAFWKVSRDIGDYEKRYLQIVDGGRAELSPQLLREVKELAPLLLRGVKGGSVPAQLTRKYKYLVTSLEPIVEGLRATDPPTTAISLNRTDDKMGSSFPEGLLEVGEDPDRCGLRQPVVPMPLTSVCNDEKIITFPGANSVMMCADSQELPTQLASYYERAKGVLDSCGYPKSLMDKFKKSYREWILRNVFPSARPGRGESSLRRMIRRIEVERGGNGDDPLAMFTKNPLKEYWAMEEVVYPTGESDPSVEGESPENSGRQLSIMSEYERPDGLNNTVLGLSAAVLLALILVCAYYYSRVKERVLRGKKSNCRVCSEKSKNTPIKSLSPTSSKQESVWKLEQECQSPLINEANYDKKDFWLTAKLIIDEECDSS